MDVNSKHIFVSQKTECTTTKVSFTAMKQWMHLIVWTYKNKPQQSNTHFVQIKTWNSSIVLIRKGGYKIYIGN